MKVAVSIVIVVLLSSAVFAQDPSNEPAPQLVQPRTGQTALTIGNDFLALLKDQMPSAYDWLQATVSVEDKAAGVSWAPFLAATTYREWLSETRFQVGQKDDKTNLGLVLRWNPLSPRGRRGMEAWTKANPPAFGDEYAKLRALRLEALRFQDDYLESAQPGIIAARTLVNDLTRQLQDMSLDEPTKKKLTADLEAASKNLAKLRDAARLARRDDLLKRIEKKREKLATESDPQKREALIAEVQQLFAAISPASTDLASIESEIAATEKTLGKKFAATVANYEQSLYTQPVPVISLSYTGTLFPGLGGSFVDADGDGLDDNAHVLAARGLLLSALMRFGPKNQLSIGAGRSWKWSSAEQGTPTSKSDNYAITYARRLKVLDPEYQKSDEYLSSLFIPSIVGGISGELSDCATAVASCQDKAERILAFTPFIDVKLKKAAQFRVGLTWKKFSGSDIADEELGVVTLISLQLGLPN